MLGPHPYPLMVREFQSVIGREARAQFLEIAGRLEIENRPFAANPKSMIFTYPGEPGRA